MLERFTAELPRQKHRGRFKVSERDVNNCDGAKQF